MEPGGAQIETVESCYVGADPALYDELLRFRAEHGMTRLPFRGREIEYLSAGSGPKVILHFHGALGSGDDTYREVRRIGDRCRIIAPTIRSLGNVEEVCDAVDAILRHEGVERVVVRGGSFGGRIAQAYVQHRHSRVDGLILVSTIPPEGPYRARDRFLVRAMTSAIGLLPERAVKWLIHSELQGLADTAQLTNERMKAEADFIRMQVSERMERVTKQEILELLRLIVDIDVNEHYAADQMPDWNGRVLILTDRSDPCFKHHEKLVGQYRSPEVHVFEGSGHLLLLLRAAEVGAIIDELLRGLGYLM